MSYSRGCCLPKLAKVALAFEVNPNVLHRLRRGFHVKCIGPAAFVLGLAVGALALRILTYRAGNPG